ncbi:TPA: hypothetical protein N3024_001858 [Klebsiella pneumoniae]|nr:hypothetical protein [Klebsiella pneumoniae]
MSTYKTKNPLGSAAVKDLYDNAENVDKFVNDRTKEELEDRLGVLRKTWHGMEMIFSRFIDYITGRGEQAVAAIGWQELGNWAVGLAVDNRQQIVYYNGSWYKYLGELEHVIAGDSPENDGGVWSAANPTGKWSNIGDAALRSNLGSSDGSKWVGQADTFDVLRATEPSVDKQSIPVRRHNTATTVGGGEFYYDASDSTTEDNSCTVVVTAGGARWKRKNVGDEIHMEWAGARTAEYTDEAQDEAFENCLKAAAVGSLHGYPCRRIVAPMFGKIRLKERHYCRGGVYPLSTGAGVVTEPLNGKFGIDGHFIMEKGSGFYVVQTVGAEFNLMVDNESLTDESKKPSLGVTGGVDYILRLEGFNQNPKINLDVQSYGGNGLYVLGKGATSENAAHWPDLTDDYQGINNATGGRFNFRNCGRGFNLNNNLSGLGSLGAVWEQWSSGASTFNGVADLTFEHYETTVPYNAAKKQGSLIFNNCGQLRFGYLAIGSGGKPLCAFNNCMSVQIDSYYAVHGEDYAVTAAAYMTGMEIANTVVKISSAILIGPNGIPFVIGRGGALYLDAWSASGVSRLAVLTNQDDYLTTFADSTSSPTWKLFGKLVLGKGETLYMNRQSSVLSAQPSILIAADMADETFVSITDMRNLFAHNGFTGADDRYFIRNESNFAEIQLHGSKFGDSAYPIYCRQPYNIAAIKGCTLTGQIVFSSGEKSTPQGGKFYKATGDQLTPSSPLSNTSKVKMSYFISYTVATGGSIQVAKNGKTIYKSAIVGEHPVSFDLMPGETATATYNTATTTISDYNTAYTYH